MKDAFYFPHDSNAKDDPKCVMLIEQLGLEGYGIYWVLIETLREQPDYKYPIKLLPALSRRYNTTLDKMKVVVFNYDLFQVEGDEFFYSESLMRRMQIYDHKREMARMAGKKSAQKRLSLNAGSTDVQPTFNDRSTSKVNKSKVNKINKDICAEHTHTQFTPPTVDDVKAYCRERSNHVDPEKFVDFYSSKGWMVGKNKMKDWKAAVRTWEKDDKARPQQSKAVNKGNFDQRQYSDADIEKFYKV